jgi:hypothetical protein
MPSCFSSRTLNSGSCYKSIIGIQYDSLLESTVLYVAIKTNLAQRKKAKPKTELLYEPVNSN